MEPDKLTKSTIEEVVEAYKNTLVQIEEFEGAKTVLKEEIIRRIDDKRTNAIKVAGDFVTKIKRVIFNIPLDKAKELGAVVTKEVPDTKVLKELYDKGIEIPGATEIEYIKIDPIEKVEK